MAITDHDHTITNDGVCPMCGTSVLASMLAGATDTEKEQATPKQRKPRYIPAPDTTKLSEVRRAVRIELLAKIPGCNRAIATAILAVFPNSTFSRIVTAPDDELANIQVGRKTLGRERAAAVKRIVK